MAQVLRRGYDLTDADNVGSKPIQYDSFVDFKIIHGSKVSDFPLETGSFASYNKTKIPAKITIRLARSGKTTDQTAFLEALRVAVSSATKFAILTPEQLYTPFTLASFDYSKTNKDGGWGSVVAACHFDEIREIAPKYSSNVKVPAAQNTQGGGKDEPGEYVPDVIRFNTRGSRP